MKPKNIILVTITATIILLACCSQQPVFGQKFEVGIFGGTSYYMGDLNPEPIDQFANARIPALGVFGRYNMNEHLSLKLGFNYGSIEGNDADSEYDVLGNGDIYHFETDIAEAAIQLDINFLPFVAGDPTSLYTPYVFGGISGFYFDPVPKRERGGTIDVITDDSHWHVDEFDENNNPPSYSNFNLGINFGMGMKFHVTNNITGGLEWGLRYTGTDYLDEVSMQGNPKNNDWYSFAGISFTIKFKDRSGAVCPPNFL